MASCRSLMVVASNTLLRQQRRAAIHTKNTARMARSSSLLQPPYYYAPFSNTAAAASKEEEPQDFYSPKVKEMYDKMITLDPSELKVVAKLVMEKLGLPIPLPGTMQRASLSSDAGDEQQQQEETTSTQKKTAFDLKLTGFDAKAKIKVIKEVRAAVAGLGLKEAKELVEGAPKIITKDLKMEKAEELKQKLEEVGATVEIV